MSWFKLVSLLALIVVAQCYGGQQVQMPEAAELTGDDDLQSQIRDLQQNVSSIWNYIYELRSAVSNHLNHLRQHQVVLETSMHKMEHLHESELHSSGYHSHSGEHHSHSGEQHSHGGEHSHSGEHHSHGSGDHSHSGEQHSHSGEHHSHSGEHHSHSGEHGHYSHSHSHSVHDHSKEDGSHSHGDNHHQHGHNDSHETEDLQQQTQQAVGAPPVSEPVVVATDRRHHSHSHHYHSSHSSRSGNVDGMNLMNENNFHRHHHHHSHDSDTMRRNRTVELPKYSDYGLYDLAMCDVTPNRAIPDDQQQNVVGSITLWQKKTGGPLNLHVQLQGFDVDGHHGHHQSVQQEEDNETPKIGHKHGFHVHTNGDLSNGCQSTGSHFNPKGSNHGGPNSLVRHVGDLGSISCDDHGNTNIVFSDDVASLRGPYSIIGKALVIHKLEDDLGQGGNEESLKTGNAGTRIACCVIRRVDKIPIRQHKVMKLAVQHQNR